MNVQQADVDYILVSNRSLDPKKTADRTYFQEGLKSKGLLLEHEKTANHIFTKLYLPDDVKFKYFEILELRMPLLFVHVNQQPEMTWKRCVERSLRTVKKMFILDRIQIALKRLRNYYLHEDDDMDELEKQRFAPFKEKRQKLFDLESEYTKKKIWKIQVIYFILSRQKWRDDPDDSYVGIEALIHQDIYTAAFPLHDGNYTDEGTTRNNLYNSWSTLCIWKNLPSLDDMRDYMGNKCAVYFAWLEFYTKMLLPASVLGILLILYGLITLPTDKFSDDVCKATNVTMCPDCAYKNCNNYHQPGHNCFYARMTHLFDNDFTIVYSTLMALWTSVLIGLWRRRFILLQRKWNLLDSLDEKPRIEFIRQLKRYRNMSHNEHVKNIPWSLNLAAFSISISIMLFFILLITIAIVSILAYQIWITGVIYSMDRNSMLSQYGSVLISFTSSVLNLITITILNNVYSKVAVGLTERELHRTQSEYDRALTIKNFVFQFINTYASIFYIALFKGIFIGSPDRNNTIFGYRIYIPGCKNGSCIMELNIQLAVIMVGKQMINSFKEKITTAQLKRLFSNKNTKQGSKLSENVPLNQVSKQYQTTRITDSCWEQDNQLLDYEEEGGLFKEYLELTIQYGFVILFVPAFPLASFFAWIKNHFEIRMDATKMLTLYRRLVPHLNPNMMIWLEIFNFIGDLAILINAIVIAFSSNVLTHFVYTSYNNGSDIGYFDATLSAHNNSSSNVSICYYAGFQNSNWSKNENETTTLQWNILCARIIFIILYQNIISTLKKAILTWIPETPRRLHDFQKKERDFVLNSLELKDDPEEL